MLTASQQFKHSIPKNAKNSAVIHILIIKYLQTEKNQHFLI